MNSILHLEPETEDPLEQNLAAISNFRLGRKCERVKTRQLIVGFERWGKKFYRTGLRVRMRSMWAHWSRAKPGNPFWRGRINTIDLLVLSMLCKLLFTRNFFLCYKTSYLNMEVNCTEPFPLVRVPWQNLRKKILVRATFKKITWCHLFIIKRDAIYWFRSNKKLTLFRLVEYRTER